MFLIGKLTSVFRITTDVHDGDAMLFTFVSDVETGGVYTLVLDERKEDTFQVKFLKVFITLIKVD